MTSEETTLLEFPCAFPIKAMGRSEEGFETLVREIIFRHASAWDDDAVTVRPSGAGNFTSVTIVVRAESRPQLDRIYQDLTDCDRVLMAL
ncbi:MAG: DUF493 domain-containing protein [Xanthomonadales bacterium]|nr:DUF493 domain-containing protein [Xanthomonadales bacterium]